MGSESELSHDFMRDGMTKVGVLMPHPHGRRSMQNTQELIGLGVEFSHTIDQLSAIGGEIIVFFELGGEIIVFFELNCS